MAHSLERVLTPEEQELQRYLAEIDQLKSEVATQLANLESYKAELARFSAEYHAVLGPLFAELDRLELEIEEYQLRVRLLESSPDIDATDVEDGVEEHFKAERERLDDDEAQNEQWKSAWREEEAKPNLDEYDAEELKRTYRDLAKQHHPDFAIDDNDRVERENAMKKVNQAFAARDLTSLKMLQDELFDHLTAFERMSIGEKLVWAIREVSRSNSRIKALVNERESLANTSIARLYAQENILILLTRQTQSRIAELGSVLRDLHTKHHQMESKQWSNNPSPAQLSPPLTEEQ